jgi:TPR repeat protein
MAAAEAGKPIAQKLLAFFYYRGLHGVGTNHAQAYKWAARAAAQNDRWAKSLVAEFNLMMKAEDIAKGKQEIADYLKQHKLTR